MIPPRPRSIGSAYFSFREIRGRAQPATVNASNRCASILTRWAAGSTRTGDNQCGRDRFHDRDPLRRVTMTMRLRLFGLSLAVLAVAYPAAAQGIRRVEVG